MISPQDLFARAKAALATGQTESAREIFRQILEAHPNSAETHFHLARLELQNGKAKKAKRHLLTAMKLRPKEPGIWLALMDTEIALRDKKNMARLLAAAKAKGMPGSVLKQLQNKAMTGNKQGVAKLVGITEQEFQNARAAYMAGRFEDAEKLASQLIRKSPKTAALHAIRAASLAQTGEIALARLSYEKAISIDPEYFEARLQLGQLLMGAGDLAAAGDHLTKALEMAKDSPHVHMSLGILHCSLSNMAKAIEHLEIAQKSLPNEARLILNLAQAYQAEARPDDAMHLVKQAHKMKLNDAEKLILVKTYLDMEDVDQARTILDDLLARNPDSVEVLSTKVNFDTTTGDFESMRAHVRKLVEQDVINGSHLLTYARGGKIAKDDPIPAAMEKALTGKQEDDETRSSLGFALAKVYDDWGEYRRSFKYLKSANDEMRHKTDQKPDSGSMAFEMVQRMFERSVDLWPPIDTDTAAGGLKPRLIQITGMPRSGTTLVEQIVSSHSTVTAGGELGLLGNQVRSDLDLLDLANKPLTAEGLSTFGTDLTKAYAGLFPESEVVTDKGLMTNEFAGIFAHALPKSRMVVLLRDPRDNCLSIYKNKFRLGTHGYSTDLEALARQYLQFLDIQKYWKEKTPGAFYEIRYEDLIENPEEESRRLIDYCGLVWEDACLEFYKNTRQVKTLSAFQVRQKIYSSSVGAWKHYEDELQPLIRILDEGGALEGY